MNEKKILGLVRQLSESEQKVLADYIKRQYAVEFKGEVVRDDVVNTVVEGLYAEFEYIEADSIKEESTFAEIDVDAVDIVDFTVFLMEKFEIEEIEFRKLMEWSTVKDVVDYVEDALENKGSLDDERN